MDDFTTKRRFESQATWVIDVFGSFSDMLPIGVCTTRHLETSGRLVQELNVCTVYFGRYVLKLYCIECLLTEPPRYKILQIQRIESYTNKQNKYEKQIKGGIHK